MRLKRGEPANGVKQVTRNSHLTSDPPQHETTFGWNDFYLSSLTVFASRSKIPLTTPLALSTCLTGLQTFTLQVEVCPSKSRYQADVE